MLAMMFMASSMTFAGDSDGLKAILKAKTYDEASQLLKQNLGSLADNAEKAKAYNHVLDLVMKKVDAETKIITENQLATQMGYSRALDELERVVKLAPDFAYAWYNMGNIYLAKHERVKAYEAYTKALNIDPRFPDAYYNRGLASILDGQVQRGLSDLSQAGEYGLYGAYNLIKRYSKQK